MRQADRRETVGVDYRESGAIRIAVVTIDNPPVNAGSAQLRGDLLAVFTNLASQNDLKGVVLQGASGNFVAGSDIREFDAAPVEPHLPEVISAIENLSVPVVAAIEGAALGGGYELALGCDLRLAASNAVVGLPEVTLGLIPGAGGTVRLPRLVGIAKAIALVTSGRRVKAAEAATLDMVDAVIDGDPVEAAIARLEGAKKRVLRTEIVPSSPPDEIEAAEKAALRRGKGAEAVVAAIEAIKAAGGSDVGAVLVAEREVSLRLRRGPQSQALRHLFLAERAAGRMPEGAIAREVEMVGVVGAGRMGAGIALAFAMRGFRVMLTDANTDVLAAATIDIDKSAREMESRDRIPSAEDVTARITPSAVEQMADCQVIVEAIIEDMDAKKMLFETLSDIASPDAILATNTSYLDIDQLARAASHPERVAGLHFFNPAHVMRLIEVVRGIETAPGVIATLLKLSRKLGKVPVVARVGEGFIGNRIFSAYRSQCEFLLEEGSYPEDIDAAMRKFGMAMGPFAVFDLSGLDVAWATRKRLAPARDPEARYVSIPDILCEEGRLGHRAGKGWFRYDTGVAAPDLHVRDAIESESQRKGIARRSICGEEIQRRLLAAMINEAAWILAEDISERPGDIDLVLVNGYGFPALKGGPLHWASRQPRGEMHEAIKDMAAASGKGVAIAPNLDEVLTESEKL